MLATYSTLPILTQIFVVVISVLSVLMAGPFYNSRTVAYGPTILTMLGIFGCFIGIALGLTNFDTGDVQGSVPALVNGIKTAFWASVFGVAGALAIRVRLLLIGPPPMATGTAVHEATIDDLAAALDNMNRSLTSQDDAGLLGQFKLFREENREGLNGVKGSIDQYMEKISKSNSEALIEALNGVIREFNTRMTEQFGDNFKQLNAAVEKLVQWQETWRQQISEMVELQGQAATSMGQATERYAMLLTEAEAFSRIAGELGTMMRTLEGQTNQVGSSLEKLGDVLTGAGENLPKIESRILDMTRQIEAGVRGSNEEVAAMVKAVTQNLQASYGDMKKLIMDAATGANREAHAHIRHLSENIDRQVTALDKALSEELNKSITTLGQHLTALSRKFVEDYAPLTDKLRSVVQMARGV